MLKFEDLKPGMKVEYLKRHSYDTVETWVPAEIGAIIHRVGGSSVLVNHSKAWTAVVRAKDVVTSLRLPIDDKKVERLEARVKELEALLKSAEAHVETLEGSNKNWLGTMNEIRLLVGAEFGQDIREIVRCLAAARDALA